MTESDEVTKVDEVHSTSMVLEDSEAHGLTVCACHISMTTVYITKCNFSVVILIFVSTIKFDFLQSCIKNDVVIS
jgi:hypothetical protein